MIAVTSVAKRPESAEPAAEGAPATRIERIRAHVAPTQHHGSVASALDAGNGRIEFLVFFNIP